MWGTWVWDKGYGQSKVLEIMENSLPRRSRLWMAMNSSVFVAY